MAALTASIKRQGFSHSRKFIQHHPSSLPSAQLRTGAGTHNHRPWSQTG
jgi:hypothetical protein